MASSPVISDDRPAGTKQFTKDSESILTPFELDTDITTNLECSFSKHLLTLFK